MRRKLTLSLVLSFPLWAVSVPTAQYDNARDGANNQETILTPGTLTRLHRLGSYSVDGPVWNQPLIAQGINGRDLLLACTLQDSCYAFDATQPGSAYLWSTHLATPRSNYPGVTYGTMYQSPVGCLATPVLDLFNQALFVICGTSAPAWIIYKLSLGNGSVLASVSVSGSVPGTGDLGDTVVNGQLIFNPERVLSRPALTLANGNVYAAFGSYNDDHPWHGWIAAYNASTLTQVALFCITPNNYGGSIWLSGGGLAVDSQGNLYVPTGNGTASSLANSLLKLSPTLQVLGSYTPGGTGQLESQDWDLTSGRPALVPDTSLVIFGAKDSNFYSVDASCMCSPQITLVTMQGSGLINYGIYGGSVIGNGRAFFPAHPGGIYGYSLSGTTWTLAASTTAFGYPGAALSYSSNAGNNAILWGTTSSGDAVTTPQAGILRAWNPATLTELWNSSTTPSDALGTMAKFAAPTVANGYVYVATVDSGIQVYGLPGGSGRIAINPPGVSPASRR